MLLSTGKACVSLSSFVSEIKRLFMERSFRLFEQLPNRSTCLQS